MNLPHYAAKKVQVLFSNCADKAHLPFGFGFGIGFAVIPPLPPFLVLYISKSPYLVCNCLRLLANLLASLSRLLFSCAGSGILFRA